ncbi:protein SZT2 [Lates japonicus]|uniref:Protein SZT2 n=1 Tax=Lates japonicus TaxID=270547 RepID=A0AAD3N4V0_LATJO|nr:protein SZT2 [Lates japonicus]
MSNGVQSVEAVDMDMSLNLVENEEQIHSSSCLPNELLLSLFHSSLEHELSDREILLATAAPTPSSMHYTRT